jgi:acyl-coenzyme A thioesterase PaaI-like protein
MAMSEAIRSSVTDIRGLATISLTVHYLSVGASDLVASATMTRCGGSTAFASAEVRDRDAKLVATGQGAFRIIR